MSTIIKLDDYPLSYRNGMYGGMAGYKDGIIIGDSMWLVKYPKNITDLSGKGLASYSSSPLSEFIGSNIFRMLGVDTHITFLGERKNKLVVACKDFVPDKGFLLEIRTIKNYAKDILDPMLDRPFGNTGSSHCVDYEELQTHLKYNPILKDVEDVTYRFWEQAIIDILINNNDRNNGNWGILRIHADFGYKDTLAPVFDNGGSFLTKASDEKIELLLQNKDSVVKEACNTQVAYGEDGHVFSTKKFLYDFIIKSEEGLAVLLDVIQRVESTWDTIVDFMNNIPEQHTLCNGSTISVCSKARKELYILQMQSRLDNLLKPASQGKAHATKSFMEVCDFMHGSIG